MANNKWDYGGTFTFLTTDAQNISSSSIACRKIMIQPHADNKKPVHIGTIAGVTNDWVDWNAGDIFIENIDNIKDIFVKPEETGLKVKWQVAK